MKAFVVPMKLWSLLLVDAHVRFRAVEHDALTTLMGRHLFFSRASEREAANRAEGIFGRDALAYFNLTNFKHYNAMYGAERGGLRLSCEKASLIRSWPACRPIFSWP